MLLSSAPNSADTVANPDLRLWLEYLFESRPAKDVYFLINYATLLSEISNTEPVFIFDISNHFFKKVTGQNVLFSK